jgi:hypothetical protein
MKQIAAKILLILAGILAFSILTIGLQILGIQIGASSGSATVGQIAGAILGVVLGIAPVLLVTKYSTRKGKSSKRAVVEAQITK